MKTKTTTATPRTIRPVNGIGPAVGKSARDLIAERQRKARTR